MNPDDPRLTAYALGELDEAERAEVEDSLRNDPAAAAEVAALREFTAHLRTQLHREDTPGLTDEQRAAVAAAAREAAAASENGTVISMASEEPESTPKRRSFNPWNLWIPAALAASVAAIATLNLFRPAQEAQFAPKPAAAPAVDKYVAEQKPAAGKLAFNEKLMRRAGNESEQLRGVDEKVGTRSLDFEPALADRESVPPPAEKPAQSAGGRLEENAGVPMRALALDDGGEKQAAIPASPPMPAGASADAPAPTVTPPAVLAQRIASARDADVSKIDAFSVSKADAVKGPSTRSAAPAAALMAKRSEAGNYQLQLAEPKGEADQSLLEKKEAHEELGTQSALRLARNTKESQHGQSFGGAASATKSVSVPAPAAPMTAAASAPAPAAEPAPLAPAASTASFFARTAPQTSTGLVVWRELPDPLGRSVVRAKLEPVPALTTVANQSGEAASNENAFVDTRSSASLELGINADFASYSLVRAAINAGHHPARETVRIEEMLNHFSFVTPAAQHDQTLSVAMEIASCPWAPAHRLVRIALRGREIPETQQGRENLKVLADLGEEGRKLSVAQDSFDGVAKSQPASGQEDSHEGLAVGIAGAASGEKNRDALGVLDQTKAQYSGSLEEKAVETSFAEARRNYIRGGINRVVLVTDGSVVNNGSSETLLKVAADRSKEEVPLTVLGVGDIGLADTRLRELASAVGGNYGYLDSKKEVQKILTDRREQTLARVASEVRARVTFNPSLVGAYRLLGYENQPGAGANSAAAELAGNIGAGQQVTVLIELIPKTPTVASIESEVRKSLSPAGAVAATASRRVAAAAPLRPEPSSPAKPAAEAAPVHAEKDSKALSEDALLDVRLEWKSPDDGRAGRHDFSLADSNAAWQQASEDLRWSAVVAGFGMLLRDSPFKGDATWDLVTELGRGAKGQDPSGERQEFLDLVGKAKTLKAQ